MNHGSLDLSKGSNHVEPIQGKKGGILRFWDLPREIRGSDQVLL